MATFTTAVAELVPVLLPDILFRLISAGNPFPEFAAVIKPTTFARGKTSASGIWHRLITWWRSPGIVFRRPRT